MKLIVVIENDQAFLREVLHTTRERDRRRGAYVVSPIRWTAKRHENIRSILSGKIVNNGRRIER